MTGRSAILFMLAFAACVAAQDPPRYGDALYQPRLRQPGKDVMWLPTPEPMVERMLAGRWALRDVQPVLGAYVEGDIVGFTFVGQDGGIRSVRARVDGGTLAGSLNFAGSLTPFTGQRR